VSSEKAKKKRREEMGKKTKANQNSTGFCFYFLLFFFSEMKSLDLVINLSNFEKRIGSGRAFLFKFFSFFFSWGWLGI